MTGHGHMRLMLYEYVRGELGEQDRRRMEDHLQRCPACTAETAALRSVLKVVPDAPKRPSGDLPEAYWKGFANEVMGRIANGPVRRPGLVERLAGRISGLMAAPSTGAVKFPLGIAAAAVAAVILYFAVPWSSNDLPVSGAGRSAEPDVEESPGRIADRVPAQTPEQIRGGTDAKIDAQTGERQSRQGVRTSGRADETAGESAAGFSPDSLTDFDRRLYDYFRRSKALLVGVSNLDPAEEETADLGAERAVSRSLVREARYLKTGPVDTRSYRLMDDLDQIMIGLANSDSRSPAPAVEVVRDGIEMKNLLFKLRMQETRQYRTPFRQASYHR